MNGFKGAHRSRHASAVRAQSILNASLKQTG